ncbi:hypothetical protein MTO96_008304 [Rhipicephalus appendiculatus]
MARRSAFSSRDCFAGDEAIRARRPVFDDSGTDPSGSLGGITRGAGKAKKEGANKKTLFSFAPEVERVSGSSRSAGKGGSDIGKGKKKAVLASGRRTAGEREIRQGE